MSAGDAMIEAFADAVMERLARRENCPVRLLDIDAAAAYLGMTTGALQKKAGVDVPVVKIDSRLRFDKRDLDKYIDRAPREGV